MVDLILIAVLIIIVGVAIAYIIRAKRRGVACIGCPNAGACSQQRQNTAAGCGGNCGGCTGCGHRHGIEQQHGTDSNQ